LYRDRRKILESLLEEEEPWLESSSALQTCLTLLTDSKKPMNTELLERLFHSCRMEAAVTNECVIIIQELWVHASDDKTRTMLLHIIDRLIDPMIMQKNDPIFLLLNQWLRDQEPLVNPYKR
jgi:uncharacterized protein (DUF1697 family)